MDISYRKANKNDFQEINNLFIEMLETIYNKQGLSGYGINDLDRFFFDDENIIYVATINEKIVGFISIEFHNEDGVFLYLDDFSVSKEYRGSGIGTKLINMACDYAISLNIKKIYLHVEKSNTKAISLYERLEYSIYLDENNRYKMIKKLA